MGCGLYEYYLSIDEKSCKREKQYEIRGKEIDSLKCRRERIGGKMYRRGRYPSWSLKLSQVDGRVHCLEDNVSDFVVRESKRHALPMLYILTGK